MSLALATGIVAAVCELVITGLRKAVFGEFVWTGALTVWTTPASWLLFMLPVGLALAVAGRWLPERWLGRVVPFATVFVASFCVAFMFYPELHPVAIAIVALGIATQATRLVVRHPEATAILARRVAFAGAVTTVAAAAVVQGGRVLAEHRAMAGLPPAPAGSPNVLLVVLDAVRAENLGLYGYARETSPALDSLARGGTVFTNAIAPAPWTLPSHASMFTGVLPHRHRADWLTPLAGDLPTLADVFRARGYATAGFVGNVAYASRETGLARGFAHYEDYVVSPGEFLEASAIGRFIVNNPRLRALLRYQDIPGRRRVGDIAAAFLRWEAGRGQRPFFAFLNIYDAHEPYLPPRAYATRFSAAPRDNRQIRLINARLAERTHKDRMSAAQREAEEAAYDATLLAIDDGLRALLAGLERRHPRERTLIVITADHGEQFGEHDLFSHGNSLYRPLLRVPLVIVDPGTVAAGARVDQVVSLADLPATILALAGVTRDGVPGTTLLGRSGLHPGAVAEVRPAPNAPERYPASRGAMQALVTDEWYFITNADGTEQLFSAADTDQLRDVAHTPAGDSVRAVLRATLRASMEPP